MAKKARHVYGNLENVAAAKEAKTIDSYDILFLDGDTEPKIGWLDKNGETRIVDTEKVVVVNEENLPSFGEEGKVYIFKSEGYFWDGSEFKPLAKSADLSELEAKIDSKVDESKVLELIEQSESGTVDIIEI